jgi:hypothetical protein
MHINIVIKSELLPALFPFNQLWTSPPIRTLGTLLGTNPETGNKSWRMLSVIPNDCMNVEQGPVRCLCDSVTVPGADRRDGPSGFLNKVVVLGHLKAVDNIFLAFAPLHLLKNGKLFHRPQSPETKRGTSRTCAPRICSSCSTRGLVTFWSSSNS